LYCETRWGTARALFQSLLKEKDTIDLLKTSAASVVIDGDTSSAVEDDRLLDDDFISDDEPLEIDQMDLDWTLILEAIDLLEPIGILLSRLESESKPTLSTVLPSLYAILRIWNRRALTGDEDDTVQIAKAALDKYFGKLHSAESWDKNKALWMATWLDPRYSNFDFVDDSAARGTLRERCHLEAEPHIPNHTTEGDNVLDRELNFGDEGTEEIRAYEERQEPRIPSFDLLNYWRCKSNIWPGLTSLALLYHLIPASSAPSERSFSQCNLVLTAHRNRLTEEHARMLCLIAVHSLQRKRN
jgi:hypothetical protein